MIPPAGAGWPRALLALALLLGAGAAQCAPAPASTPASAPGEEARLSAMERQQQSMLAQVRQQVDALPDSPRRDALLRQLRDIEHRMEAEHRVAYVSPSTPMTAEMKTYYARLVRRIEDCGTRHFPRRDGKSAYGTGVASITLDRQGIARRTGVVRSSGSRLVDRHFEKLVRASSPFGSLPARITTSQAGEIDTVIVVTSFDFKNDDQPAASVPDQEQCRWPAQSATRKGKP